MSKHLYLQSERVSASGGVTSSGVLNQLGRPQMEPLTVLLREAVQNSWDARSDSVNPVEVGHAITFGAAGWTMTRRQRNALNKKIFDRLPPAEHLYLENVLRSEGPLHTLVIYDRGTTGLGGPTRADRATPDKVRDFVDFMRNVGQPPDKKLAGGTYGYGKAAFYRISRASTICVHTRCMYEGEIQSRFICAALGKPYVQGGVPYTGRHWWGRKFGEVRTAEPLLNRNADIAAKMLGMPEYQGDTLGTTIMILQPRIEINDDKTETYRSPWQSMNLLAESALYYFWPKMLRYDRGYPDIKFKISWEGKAVPIPDPQEYAPLKGYVDAMYRLKGHDVSGPFPHNLEDVASRRPKQHLGRLALQKYPAAVDDIFDLGSRKSIFDATTHHTALMRQPELVVKYLAGPVSANPELGYAGVFVADEEVDKIFADSEPPTHDEWVAEALEDSWHQTYVRVSKRRIREFMEIFAAPTNVEPKARELTPLGHFSNSLGASLLSSVPGNSATTPFGSTYTPPKPGKITAEPPRGSGDVSEPDSSPDTTPSESGGLFGKITRLIAKGEMDNTSKGDEATGQNGGLPEPPQTPDPQETPRTQPGNPSVFGGDQDADGDKIEPEKPRKAVGRSRVQANSEPQFVAVDGKPALKISFNVKHGKNAAGTEVTVRTSAVIDGGALETDPPVGGSRSEVIRWIDPENHLYGGSQSIFITAKSVEDWQVVVSLPDDIMVDVDFTAKAVSENS